ncbi:hypothetical protein GOP47_0017594 [Adiantum capillus-veneris]|uniref:Uncharacterized protein n=1 Tax=Adiantum capillus-veneris TaxID=13818 RepID=A0A9D4UGV2_ADICA|nr:hypothetical protein GOP47_0017594 [Adiantum capillus-veneris]
MKPLFDWLRSWRQSKSSKTGDMHTNTFTPNKESYNGNQPHHYPHSSLPIVLPPSHHHHHHHEMRLLKSCRIMPLTTTDDHNDNHNNMRIDDDYYDDDDVDIEFSTMMMASFATITRPPSHRAQGTHLTSTTTFSPNKATMPHSVSMPKAHSSTPRSPAPDLHLPPRRSIEGPSNCLGSPMVHPRSAHAKKSSRMPRSPLLRVLGRPPLPDSSSTRPREQVAMSRSPLTHATRHPPSPTLSSTTRRAKEHPSSIPQSPSTRTKGSLKTPHSPSIRAMAYPAIVPHSPVIQAMEKQLQSLSPNTHGPASLSMHASSGLDLPLAKERRTRGQTYQPLCCSSGTCILECHETETSKKVEAQAQKRFQPKKPVKYGMTIVPTKDGPRVRRLSFKNGKWIFDDSDYVVLEL